MQKKLISLTSQQVKALKKIKIKTGICTSELIRRAVDYFLAKGGEKE